MRDEFIDLLSRLVVEGFITEQEANRLLAIYDESGDLPAGWQLPLPIELALEVGEIDYGAFFPESVDEELFDQAQDSVVERITEITDQLNHQEITLKDWHRKFKDALIDYMAAAAITSATHSLNPIEQSDVEAVIVVQLAYLSRFADQAATGRLSAEQVLARAKLYSGEGRALFYEWQEEDEDGYGTVVDYIAVDDRNTCSVCEDAERNGPYLPGQGPMPGRECLGKGRCRCRRAARYDVAAYLSLTGRSP